jgi:hypothetical protein
MILFVIFAPFRYFLLFLLISIILLLIHPTKYYGTEHVEVSKIDKNLSTLSFVSLCVTFIFAIICLFYYIKF